MYTWNSNETGLLISKKKYEVIMLWTNLKIKKLNYSYDSFAFGLLQFASVLNFYVRFGTELMVTLTTLHHTLNKSSEVYVNPYGSERKEKKKTYTKNKTLIHQFSNKNVMYHFLIIHKKNARPYFMIT